MADKELDKIKNKASQEEDFVAIKRILAGDGSAFYTLEKKYKRLIQSLIRRMIKNEDDVDDLTQESFIKAYSALPSFQFGYSFSAWLYRIASNTCIDFLRKKRFKTISLNQQIDSSEEDHEFQIEDKTYQPDLFVLDKERKNVILNAIDQLPDQYKLIIQLRHDEEMDYLEISKKLNIPLGTVKAHLFRARKMLLASLKGEEYLFQDN